MAVGSRPPCYFQAVNHVAAHHAEPQWCASIGFKDVAERCRPIKRAARRVNQQVAQQNAGPFGGASGIDPNHKQSCGAAGQVGLCIRQYGRLHAHSKGWTLAWLLWLHR